MHAKGSFLALKPPLKTKRISPSSEAAICLPDESRVPGWDRTARPTWMTARSSHGERSNLRKRIAVLVAAIAVPAMAAPGDFGAVAGDAPIEHGTTTASLATQPAMPFEQPGMSFPGSAFYYLADPPTEALVVLPTSDPLSSGGEAGRELGTLIDVGPAAAPFFAAGSGVSQGRALDCLAQAVWYEAASESDAGQRAVAQVVLNRVAHPSWPGSVCGVVYQGSQRKTGCQFTFTCDGSLARKASGTSWARARRVAKEALAGSVYGPVGHATHYHTLWVNPSWASRLDHIGTIGAHRFYRNRGANGDKAAFTTSYVGFEPGVRGRIQRVDVSLPALPDAATSDANGLVARTGSTSPVNGAMTVPLSATSQEPPGPAKEISSLADPELASVGQVKSEFARAGQWKERPAKSAETDASDGEDKAQTAEKPAD